MNKTFRDYIILIENNSTTILTEYDRSKTIERIGSKLLDRYTREAGVQLTDPADREEVLDNLLAKLEAADPTKNKQYTEWLIDTYIRNPNLKLADLTQSTVSGYLSKYFQLTQKKQIPPPNNNIKNLKTLDDLASLVGSMEVKQKPEADKGESREYYKDNDVRVIIPLDVKAACYYGQGTSWCTARTKGVNQFDVYNKQGRLYIVVPLKPEHPGEKYQLFFPDMEFRNESDDRINLYLLLERFPQLYNVFATELKQAGLDFSNYESIKREVENYITRWQNDFAEDIDKSIDNNTDISYGSDIAYYANQLKKAIDTDKSELADIFTWVSLAPGNSAYTTVMENIESWIKSQPFMRDLQEKYKKEFLERIARIRDDDPRREEKIKIIKNSTESYYDEILIALWRSMIDPVKSVLQDVVKKHTSRK